jgi:hypothetical protein
LTVSGVCHSNRKLADAVPGWDKGFLVDATFDLDLFSSWCKRERSLCVPSFHQCWVGLRNLGRSLPGDILAMWPGALGAQSKWQGCSNEFEGCQENVLFLAWCLTLHMRSSFLHGSGFETSKVLTLLRVSALESFAIVVLGFWTQRFTLARQVLYHLSHSASPVLCWIFLRGSRELFAWTDLEPRSSWSLSPEQLGLQVWATSTQLHLNLPTGWAALI